MLECSVGDRSEEKSGGISAIVADCSRRKIVRFQKMWVFSLPRMAREITGFAQDVYWVVGLAKDYYWPPRRRSEPQLELATNVRLQPREEPEEWAREYEPHDPGWTLVRTSNDPFYRNPRVM